MKYHPPSFSPCRSRISCGAAIRLAVVAAAATLWAATARAETACITLGHDAQVRLGIVTSRPSTVTTAIEEQALLQLLDPVPLILLLADLTTAQAALAHSTAELARLQVLVAADQSAAPRDLESLRAQSIADASQLHALQSRMLATWGPALGAMSTTELQAIVDALAAGRKILARLDALGARVTPSGEVRIESGGLRHLLAAVDLGAAPASDPRMQGIGRIKLLDAGSALALAPGQALPASVAGSPVRGVLLPHAAVLRWNALEWIYVRSTDTCFERRPVEGAIVVADGMLLPMQGAPEADIVEAGGASLLAAEFAGSQPQDKD